MELREPEGLGLWIWRLPLCMEGKLNKIVERCHAARIFWLAIKSGDSDSNGQITPTLIQTLHEGGIGIYTWNYSTPGTTDRQIRQIGDMLAMGVDGHIVDAEIEWEGTDRRPEADMFMRKLRQRVGYDAWIAHCPWWAPKSHPLFPWAEFGQVTNAQMPQVYWTMDKHAKAKDMILKSEQQWLELVLKMPKAVSLRSPIGSIFHGTKENAVPNGQLCSSTDVATFLNRCEENAQTVPFWSLYSWDSCPPEIWQLLIERADVLRGLSEALKIPAPDLTQPVDPEDPEAA